MSRFHPYSFVRKPDNNDADVDEFMCRKPTRPVKIYSGTAREPTLVPPQNPVPSTDDELILPSIVPSVSIAPSVPFTPSPPPGPSAVNSQKELPRIASKNQRYKPYSVGRKETKTTKANNDANEVLQFICRKATRPIKVIHGCTSRVPYLPPLVSPPQVENAPAAAELAQSKEKELKDFRPSPAPVIRKAILLNELPLARTTSKASAAKSAKAPKSKTKFAPLMQKAIKDYRLAMAARR